MIGKALAGLLDLRETVDPLHPRDPGIVKLFGFRDTIAGVDVSETTAATMSAVHACVKVLSNSVATLPWFVFERLERGRRRATEHSLHTVVHDRPNRLMTAFRWRKSVMWNLLLWGNHYSEIVRDGAGDVRELWPIPPWRVKPKRPEGTNRIVYEVRLARGAPITLPRERVFHAMMETTDGLMGLSPIDLAREQIGVGLAAERFAGAFYKHGLVPSAVISHPAELGDKARENLDKSIEKFHGGLGEKHRHMLLEEGAKYEQVSIAPENAQFLESRKFQAEEIARIYQVPPHKIGLLDRATFNNIEQLDLSYHKDSVIPWLKVLETEADDLLDPGERERFFTEFVAEGALRGDFKTRTEGYRSMWGIGAITINEIRERENLNPIDGGDTPFVPLNFVELGTDPFALDDDDVDDDDDDDRDGGDRELEQRALALDRHALALGFRKRFEQAGQKVILGEIREATKLAEKIFPRRNLTVFIDQLRAFYDSAEFRNFVVRQIGGSIELLAQEAGRAAVQATGAADDVDLDVFTAALIARFAAAHGQRSFNQLKKVTQDVDDVLGALAKRFDEWKERRAPKIAKEETIRVANASAREAFRVSGVRELRWVAVRSTCPYCNRLDGRVVGVERTFVDAGGSVEGGEGRPPLTIRRPLHHPPAHPGCDCQIVPA